MGGTVLAAASYGEKSPVLVRAGFRAQSLGWKHRKMFRRAFISLETFRQRRTWGRRIYRSRCFYFYFFGLVMFWLHPISSRALFRYRLSLCRCDAEPQQQVTSWLHSHLCLIGRFSKATSEKWRPNRFRSFALNQNSIFLAKADILVAAWSPHLSLCCIIKFRSSTNNLAVRDETKCSSFSHRAVWIKIALTHQDAC